jgi:hypothetical protein
VSHNMNGWYQLLRVCLQHAAAAASGAPTISVPLLMSVLHLS